MHVAPANRVRRSLGGCLALALVLAACAGGDGGSGDGAAADGPTTTAAPTTPVLDDDLRLNEIQVVGTHNSFRAAPPPAEFALLEALDADQAAQRTYTHRPITDQLAEQQVRQIELDVFADAEGGLYADPALRRQAGLDPLVDEVPELAEPGTKVLHEQDVDYHSVCPTLVGCLTEVRDWSEANPDHVPVAVHVQFKDGPLIFAVPDQARPEPWTTEAMDGLDAEILSVFDRDHLLTPDDVRGDAPTLEEAVLTDGWPTLGESRGKVLFLMINGAPYRDRYLVGHEGLAGRILFTNAEPGQPDASYVGVDDPVADADRIEQLVGLGYLVRTRSDVPDEEGRTGDTTRRDAAFASGAHWISTDYPGPEGASVEYGTDYVVELPDAAAARCNPVTASPRCRDDAIGS